MQMLSVRGDQIVDRDGKPVRLRGVCVGGWMNLENFINGYPGAEHGVRSALSNVLGPSLAQFFFDRWLDYILAEEDIRFIRQCGANVVRLPINYRHLEDDGKPGQWLEAGFERLDRAVQWCAQHSLYVILDLHAVQGWQSTDWHCDNSNAPALFWAHPYFQDRFVALWRELARRYKGNATIAGYDVMNEPLSRPIGQQPNWDCINQVYRRVVQAIRAIDPDHIVFLEGDVYASRFDGLREPFADNLVYSGHAYSPAGFGPGPYPGVCNGKFWDRQEQGRSFMRHQALAFAEKHNVPLWMGEFGAVYNGPSAENPDRLRALDDQIDAFEECGAHWTMWTYKDVGVMGWVELDAQSEYVRTVAPILQAKATLGTDAWMTWLPTTLAQASVRTLSFLIDQTIGDAENDPKTGEHLLLRAVLAGYASKRMQASWAKRFQGLSETDIDRALQSFALKNCRPHQALLDMVKKHTARPA